MNSPPRLVLLLAASLCAGGAAVGYFVGKQQDAAPTAGSGMAPDRSHELARLQKENAWLLAENTRLAATRPAQETPPARKASAPKSPGPVATAARGAAMPLATFAQQERSTLPGLKTQLVTPAGKLSPSFARLFGLTTAEANTLQQTLDHARGAADVLAVANSTVQQEGDTLVVRVRAFEGGADIYDQVMDRFAQVLGSERNAIFMELATDQLAAGLHGFGAETRTITFGRARSTKSPEVVTWLHDESHGRSGPKRIHSVTTTNNLTPANRAKQYGWLGSLLDPVNTLPPRQTAPDLAALHSAAAPKVKPRG